MRLLYFLVMGYLLSSDSFSAGEAGMIADGQEVYRLLQDPSEFHRDYIFFGNSQSNSARPNEESQRRFFMAVNEKEKSTCCMYCIVDSLKKAFKCLRNFCEHVKEARPLSQATPVLQEVFVDRRDEKPTHLEYLEDLQRQFTFVTTDEDSETDEEDMFEGMMPVTLDDEEVDLERKDEGEIIRQRRADEEKRKMREQLALAALECQLEELQIARNRDKEKPREKVKIGAAVPVKMGVVKFFSTEVLPVEKDVPPPCRCVDQSIYDRSFAAILARGDKLEIANKMFLDVGDIEAVFPFIFQVRFIISPNLAERFFGLVRCFITNYNQDIDKQKKLTLLLSSVFRRGYKITPILQEFTSGIHALIKDFRGLVLYIRGCGQALKSNGEKGQMMPDNF